MSKASAPPSQEIGEKVLVEGGDWLGKALLRELRGLDPQGKKDGIVPTAYVGKGLGPASADFCDQHLLPKGMEGGETRIFGGVQYNILKTIIQYFKFIF